jgi:hypothetical protein
MADKHPDFIRGYHFQGGGGAYGYPGMAHDLPGFGKGFKSSVRKYYPALLSIGGFGEVLPRKENRVSLDAEVPSNRVLEVRTQVEMLQAGLTSRTQAMEELGQDPGAVERQLLVENLKRSPEIQKRLTDRIFQLLGIQQAQAMEELGGPPGQPPGPGGPPGLPPGAPGGLAMGAPNAVAPGQGMPLAPPPPGSLTGAGSSGPAMAPGGLPSNPGGGPAVQGPPANMRPLPGQAMGT